MNPFKYFFKNYFNQSSNNSIDKNKENFNSVLDTLVNKVSELEDVENLEDLVDELERTRSMLGAIVDLHWEGSLYEQLDPKLRFENILHSIKNLILIESLLHPVIVELEDAHLIDDDSKELIKILTRNISNYPVAIICTARYNDDGSKFVIPTDEGVPSYEIDLNYLSVNGIKAIIGQFVEKKQPISDELVNFIQNRTNGNPFFIKELLLYLQEQKMIVVKSKGEYGLSSTSMDRVPSNINAVLIARLDRFSAEVKNVIQTASVLGMEFDVQLLSLMLKDDRELNEKLKLAEKGAIWSAINEIRYIFKHALMRDSVYSMQLKAKLKELHKLAGESIETLYSSDLSKYYPTLAYHYDKSEIWDKAFDYFLKAGDYFSNNYNNEDGIKSYISALRIINTNRSDLKDTPDLDKQELQIHIQLDNLYDMLGRRDEQEKNLKSGLDLCEKLNDKRAKTDLLTRFAKFYNLTGKSSEASVSGESALLLSKEIGYKEAEGEILNVMGNVYFNMGDLDKALSYYEQSLAIRKELGDRKGEGKSLNNIGNVYYNSQEFEKALPYYENALSIARKIKDRKMETTILSNIGVIYYSTGNLTEALSYNGQSLLIKQEIGDRWGQGKSLNNIGSVYYGLGDLENALSYYQHSIAMKKEVNDKCGEGSSLYSVGTIYLQMSEFEKALSCCNQALSIFKETGDNWSEGIVLFEIGKVYLAISNSKKDVETNLQLAIKHFYESEEILTEVDDKGSLVGLYSYLAVAMANNGDIDKAVDYLNKSDSLFAEIGNAGDTFIYIIHWNKYLVLKKKMERQLPPEAEKQNISDMKEALEKAYNLVTERGNGITDGILKEKYLNMSINKDIIDEWKSIV